MKKYKLILLAILLLLSKQGFSNEADYTVEELDTYLSKGVIDQEEYEVLKSEITGIQMFDDDFLYELTVNSAIRNPRFKVTRREGELGYPLIDFLSIVGVKNYTSKSNGITMLLGEDFQEANINYLRKSYSIGDKKYKYQEGEVYREKGEIYISEEMFKNLFTTSFNKDDEKYKISTRLSFKTKREIDIQLENRTSRFEDENSKDTLFFTNMKKFFDLGYLNFDLSLDYEHNSEDHRFKQSGVVEYQGGFLYGELTASYDVGENKMGDVSVYYPNYLTGHSMEIGSYGYGSHGREMGFSLRKEKGYYDEDGEIVINERVPIGSKVELLYLGFPIDVKESENGEVEFRNSELRSDRNYELKVYNPDGSIEIIAISTATNYNQQKAGSIEYDIYGREDDDLDNWLGNGRVYYGLTNFLTIGGGYEREEVDGEVLDYGVAEIILGKTYKDFDFTLVGEKEFAQRKDREKERVKLDTSYKDFRLTAENIFYGDAYEEKKEQEYSLEYNGFNLIDITYNYYIDELQTGEEIHDYDVELTLEKDFDDLLITASASYNREREKEYELNFYYTGYYLYDFRFNNTWNTEDDSYESKLSISKKQPADRFDYSFDLEYSNREEARIGLSFSFELDNWLNFDFDKRGNTRGGTLNIEKVVDLKNPLRPIDSIDVSRVHAMTYLDTNNNNIYDEGEEPVPYSDIIIGREEVRADENGEAWLYGISNDIIYDINAKIKRPSYSLGDNKLKLQGVRSGTIEAQIPIKTQVNFMGKLNLKPWKRMTKDEVTNIYENMAIRIKDSKGDFIETLLVEDDGSFVLSNIYPGEYTAELSYWGDEYEIDPSILKADIKYLDGEDKVFKFDINLKKKGGRK